MYIYLEACDFRNTLVCFTPESDTSWKLHINNLKKNNEQKSFHHALMINESYKIVHSISSASLRNKLTFYNPIENTQHYVRHLQGHHIDVTFTFCSCICLHRPSICPDSLRPYGLIVNLSFVTRSFCNCTFTTNIEGNNIWNDVQASLLIFIVIATIEFFLYILLF